MNSTTRRTPINVNVIRIIIIAVVVAHRVRRRHQQQSLLHHAARRAARSRRPLPRGKIVDVVGPGLYTDFGLYVDLRRIPSSAVSFTVEDDEIITKDKQRLGLLVGGDIFRPNLAQKDILTTNWAQYSQLYLNEDVLKSRVEGLARQAMKVCIGERTFNDNVIGTARDVLRECIDDRVEPPGRQLRAADRQCGRAEHHPLSKRPSSCWTRSRRAG